ncbi:Peroxiredoxin family protein [Lentibacillus persicus]|uniref:Peroxiredoxin family protein n=1 Tax=Lentibacillus persicus TaxID=640948 RepID=A0A1I1SE76_9BACI|nr:DsrE/DsrF/DrsH-like family protein [Lentibacillus persicus]SFD44761.1 Peroxiredoxin family protein [Lentibacillus persicus]
MENNNTRVAIIAANGGMFDAYKVFNIATAAAASDKEVGIFFTFEGLNLIHKEAHKDLPLPEGKEHFQEGFEKANVPGISDLLEMAQEMGVKMIGCQMTMDVMNLEKDDFVDGIEVGGAASFIEFAKDADISLTF